MSLYLKIFNSGNIQLSGSYYKSVEKGKLKRLGLHLLLNTQERTFTFEEKPMYFWTTMKLYAKRNNQLNLTLDT